MQKSVWAPWRVDYLKGLTAPEDAVNGGDADCFMCAACDLEPGSAAGDAALLIAADDLTLVMLNRYPYANGHLLVMPRRHVPSLTALEPAERAAMMEHAAHAEAVLRDAVHAQGCNVGVNVGQAAGAAVPGHVHLHVVPRWSGDVNFMSTVAGLRVIPEALEAAFTAVRAAW